MALHITGKTKGVPVDRLPLDTSVILTGYLEDVRPAVAQSGACVVPLRVGADTRFGKKLDQLLHQVARRYRH